MNEYPCGAGERDDEAKAFLVVPVLRNVDNYAVADGVLSLNRARMAPFARFEAAE